MNVFEKLSLRLKAEQDVEKNAFRETDATSGACIVASGFMASEAQRFLCERDRLLEKSMCYVGLYRDIVPWFTSFSSAMAYFDGQIAKCDANIALLNCKKKEAAAVLAKRCTSLPPTGAEHLLALAEETHDACCAELDVKLREMNWEKVMLFSKKITRFEAMQVRICAKRAHTFERMQYYLECALGEDSNLPLTCVSTSDFPQTESLLGQYEAAYVDATLRCEQLLKTV